MSIYCPKRSNPKKCRSRIMANIKIPKEAIGFEQVACCSCESDGYND
jgi:hypothetical protein